MLDVRRLAIFREVVRQGSFSAAALELNYSQSSISHHVARLELETGTRLFDRSDPRGVSLTAEGEALYAHVDRITAAIAAAEADVARGRAQRERQLRVGAFASAGATLVAPALARLGRLEPELEATYVGGDPIDTLERLRCRHIDVGVVFDEERDPLDVDGLDVRQLGRDPLSVALPQGHRFAAGAPLSWSDLRDERWIEGAGATTPASLVLHHVCRTAGFRPHVVANSGSYDVVQALVAAGVGIALVPALAACPARPGIALVHPSPGLPARRLWTARLAGMPVPGTVDRFTRLLSDIADGAIDVSHGIATPALERLPA